MNTLQKNHKKVIKRNAKRAKHTKYASQKTGRLKVQKRAQEEYRKTLLVESLKEKPSTTSGMIWKESQSGVYGYEPTSLASTTL